MPKTGQKVESKQTQRERFVQTAREIEVDESGETFEKAFEKLVPPNHAPKKHDN